MKDVVFRRGEWDLGRLRRFISDPLGLISGAFTHRFT